MENSSKASQVVVRQNKMSLSSSFSSSSSGGDSAFTDRDRSESPVPSTQSISAALDDYVSAARVGRAALACGDIGMAVLQFNEALSIELQTEMDCLYDTSLGFVSGLVRREVDNRLAIQGSPRRTTGAPSCDRVLEELASVYRHAERKSESHPYEAKWYLRMGASLCVVNQWEKAKKIYTEGINMCKDKKELRKALKNLSRLEQITSGKMPPEEIGTYTAPEIEPHIRTRPKPQSVSTKTFKHMMRVRPKSVSIEAANNSPNSTSLRHSSFSLPPNALKQRTYSDPPTPRKKKFSFSGKSLGKRTSAMLFGSGKLPEPSIDFEERQSWLEAFSPESSIDFTGQEFRPSAVVHMRGLSVELLQSTDLDDPDCSIVSVSEPSFDAIKFTSMRIESDDSELEDD